MRTSRSQKYLKKFKNFIIGSLNLKKKSSLKIETLPHVENDKRCASMHSPLLENSASLLSSEDFAKACGIVVLQDSNEEAEDTLCNINLERSFSHISAISALTMSSRLSVMSDPVRSLRRGSIFDNEFFAPPSSMAGPAPSIKLSTSTSLPNNVLENFFSNNRYRNNWKFNDNCENFEPKTYEEKKGRFVVVNKNLQKRTHRRRFSVTTLPTENLKNNNFNAIPEES
ncbi:hypothetical protein HDU92_004305 [Lobulomyces angularis]|nr:hypothetical protein HDU92_004305 [Lobulomyces angularis]